MQCCADSSDSTGPGPRVRSGYHVMFPKLAVPGALITFRQLIVTISRDDFGQEIRNGSRQDAKVRVHRV